MSSSKEYIDEVAEISEEEAPSSAVFDDEDSETDEHIPDTYDNEDGFIVGDDEVEEDYSTKKRRRSVDEDEDDNIEPEKRKKRFKKPKLKRLRKKNQLEKEIKDLIAGESTPEAPDEFQANNAAELRETLFSSSAASNEEGINYDDEEDNRPSRYREYEEDDMSDFIIGRPRRVQDDDIFSDNIDYGNEVAYAEESTPLVSTQEGLKKMFSPDEIAEQYMTEEDEIIKNTDIPERFQLRKTLREVSENELVSEANWIYNQVFKAYSRNPYGGRSNNENDEYSWGNDMMHDENDTSSQLREKIVSQITDVLRFILINRFDIPYIAQYKKEYFKSNLNDSDLWTIFDYDEKWRSLQLRKQHVRNLYSSEATIAEFYYNLLDKAEEIEDVEDLASHFTLHFSSRREDDTRRRRASRRDTYLEAKKTKAGEFVANFGITSTQYAENLNANLALHRVINQSLKPTHLATEYLSTKHRTEESLLNAARNIMAREIAAEPYIRYRLRQAYKHGAQISVILTAKGQTTTLPRLRDYKNIQRNDIKSYEHGKELLQLMQIFKDELDELVQVKIELPEDKLNDALKAENFFYSAERDDVAQSWNEQRFMIIEEVKKMLVPLMESFVRSYYMKKGRIEIGYACQRSLESILKEGPFGHSAIQGSNSNHFSELDDDIDNPRPTRHCVMACCAGEEKEMTTFVMLDSDGNLTETYQWQYDQLKYLQWRNDQEYDQGKQMILKSNPESKKLASMQENELREFIKQHNPHVIAVATTGLNSLKLYELLDKIIRELRDKIRCKGVYYTPDDFARIYEVSKRANREFPGKANIVKRAVSIGRRLNDPLTEIAGLFNTNNDILCFKYHDLQGMLPVDYFASIVEQSFVKIVNQVGVDINRIMNAKHLQSTLRFVGGLGPRKADQIIKAIQARKQPYLTKRKQLVDPVENGGIGIGKIVFMNCAGFIRIIPPPGVSHAEFDILDNTRIHPENYRYAIKIATDALDAEDEDEDAAIDAIMKQPELLDELDLVAYAEELEKRGLGKKHDILEDIKAELKAPFRDPRFEFEDLKQDPQRLFNYVTGGGSVQTGQLVSALILREDKRNKTKGGYYCLLDNGLNAYLPVERIRSLKELTPGTTIECLVEEIFFKSFTIILSYDDKAIEDKRREQMVIPSSPQAKPKRKKRQVKRNISHPNYRNFTYGQAVEYLTQKPEGEVIVRPSSKGPDHLAVTFKFFDDQYINLDVKEEDKADISSLGRKLKIKDRTYSDIDEICVRYVQEFMDFAKKLIKHHKFNPGKPEEIEQKLMQEKKENPKSIPYRIGFNPKQPGSFIIYYLPNNRVKKQYLSVTPEGYMFNQRSFPSVTKLLNAFKTSHSQNQVVRPSSSSEPSGKGF
jgi:transcription elongation factor SPT6